MAKQPVKVLASGSALNVEAVVIGGRCLATDFLEGLEARTRARFYTLFERLANVGSLRNPDEMRQIKSKGTPVFEVKCHLGPGYRMYGRFDAGVFMITHGRTKPKDRAVADEAERARVKIHEWTSQ
jgi:putative component of toxin-antitoxin plasmid stabilization module